MSQQLHFGVTPWRSLNAGADQATARALTQQASKAETLGYESFWLPESHFTGAAAIPDPLMSLASVAGATERIRLATTSYLLPLRHPIQAAEQVAVLDRLSEGRVLLGVGRGFQNSLFQAFDVDAKEKRSRFEACLLRMQDAWKGEALGQDLGSDVVLAPQPVQRPHPPIWAAAFGPRAIEQAARLGLPYLASPVETLEHLKENYCQYREWCAQNNSKVPDTVPVMRTVFLSSDAGEIARVEAVLKEQMKLLQGRGTQAVARAGAAQVSDWALLGDRDQIRQQIARYRRELGMTHLIITRLRVNSLPGDMLEENIERIAELLGQC